MPTTSTENNTMTLGDDGANSPVELQLTGDQKLKMTLWLDEKWSVPAIGCSRRSGRHHEIQQCFTQCVLHSLQARMIQPAMPRVWVG